MSEYIYISIYQDGDDSDCVIDQFATEEDATEDARRHRGGSAKTCALRIPRCYLIGDGASGLPKIEVLA